MKAAIIGVLLSTSVVASPILIERADPRDIPYLCAAYANHYDDSVGGCTIYPQTPTALPRIIIPTRDSPNADCIYHHELRHVREGDWHKGRKDSSCG